MGIWTHDDIEETASFLDNRGRGDMADMVRGLLADFDNLNRQIDIYVANVKEQLEATTDAARSW